MPAIIRQESVSVFLEGTSLQGGGGDLEAFFACHAAPPATVAARLVTRFHPRPRSCPRP